MTTRRLRNVLVGLAIGGAAVGGAATSWSTGHAQPEARTGLVRVVHGLRGLVADVYLDGDLALPTFRPERATDPLPILAGDHLVEIRQAGAAATDEPLLSQKVTVPGGFQGSLVAHLDGDGTPKLTAFADDLSAVPAGQSRLVVRHVAEARPVDVMIDGSTAFSALAPDGEAGDVTPAGAHEVAVTPAGGGQPLAAPERVDLDDGTANFMYLIGSQAEGTLGWAAVRIDDLQTAPTRIQTGDGSTERRSDGGGLPVGLLVTATVAIGAVGIWSRSRRQRSVL
jgi:hypothetical protein